MIKVVIESHLGGYYVVNSNEVEGCLEICEQCGDCDWDIMSFDTEDISSMDLSLNEDIGILQAIIDNSSFTKDDIVNVLKKEFYLHINKLQKKLKDK